MKRWLKVVVVAGIAVAIVAAVAFTWLATVPRWTGRGDWIACARLARVGPDDAVRAAADAVGAPFWRYQAEVTPGFVNSTGWRFPVTCTDQPAVGDPLSSWQEPPSDRTDHFGWSVLLGEDWTLCSIPAFVDWTTGAEILWGGRAVPPC